SVALGPVQARAGDQLHLVAIGARDGAVAIELDLVQPLLAGRHARGGAAEPRPGGLGERRVFRTLEPRRLDRLRPARRFRRRLRRAEFLDQAAAQHALRPLLQDRAVGPGPGEGVALLDQEPVVAALTLLGLEAHKRPAAAELLAVEAELEAALAV